MEGSGIIDAGWVMDKDIMVARGICDYCDGYKDDSWQRYAALAAAAYTRSLIEALPEEWFPSGRLVRLARFPSLTISRADERPRVCDSLGRAPNIRASLGCQQQDVATGHGPPRPF
jgi:hypothetical protein